MSSGPVYMGTCTAHCKPCCYRDKEFNSCSYILIAGHMRGCPVGDGCDKLDTGKRQNLYRSKKDQIVRHAIDSKGQPAQERRRPGKKPGIDLAEHQKRLKLYLQGYTDREVAIACGCAESTIVYWRRKNSLESNFLPNGRQRRRDRKEDRNESVQTEQHD